MKKQLILVSIRAISPSIAPATVPVALLIAAASEGASKRDLPGGRNPLSESSSRSVLVSRYIRSIDMKSVSLAASGLLVNRFSLLRPASVSLICNSLP